LAWSTICATGTSSSNCPLVDSDKPNSVNFNLKSENFCAEVTVEVGLTGTLASFEDSGLSVVRTAYVVGRRAYFLVKVNSELNPAPYADSTAVVKFTDVKLSSVTIRPEGASPIRVWEKFAKATFAVEDDPVVDIIAVDRTPVNEVAFNFLFTSKLAALLQPNSVQKFTIGAEVQVVYSSGAKKRDVSQTPAPSSTESISFSSEASITSINEPTPNGSSYSIVASIVFLIFALLF